jgi:hypothetical protein
VLIEQSLDCTHKNKPYKSLYAKHDSPFRRIVDVRANGLPFSRRERIQNHCSKPNDLAREAVGCNGVLDGG